MLFVDEIHRLNAAVEEVLYPAMEDFEIDIMIGEGPAARSIRMPVQPFTLDRRDHAHRAAHDAAARPVRRLAAAGVLRRSRSWHRSCGGPPASCGVRIDDDSALEIAGRSRGTPRVANRLLRRVRDFAEVRHEGDVDHAHLSRRARTLPGRRRGARQARPRHPVRDRRRSSTEGRSGLDTLAVALGEESDTLHGRLRAVPDHARLPHAHSTRSRAHTLRVSCIAGSNHRLTADGGRSFESGGLRPAASPRERILTPWMSSSCTPVVGPARLSPCPRGGTRASSRSRCSSTRTSSRLRNWCDVWGRCGSSPAHAGLELLVRERGHEECLAGSGRKLFGATPGQAASASAAVPA